jgi:hypothetical protein
MEHVYSANSYPYLPVKVFKAEWGRSTATPFPPRLHATVGFCQLSVFLSHGCSQLKLQAHPSPRLQPPVHLMERVRSVESHPRLPVKVVLQARVRPVALDRPMPLPS